MKLTLIFLLVTSAAFGQTKPCSEKDAINTIMLDREENRHRNLFWYVTKSNWKFEQSFLINNIDSVKVIVNELEKLGYKCRICVDKKGEYSSFIRDLHILIVSPKKAIPDSIDSLSLLRSNWKAYRDSSLLTPPPDNIVRYEYADSVYKALGVMIADRVTEWKQKRRRELYKTQRP